MQRTHAAARPTTSQASDQALSTREVHQILQEVFKNTLRIAETSGDIICALYRLHFEVPPGVTEEINPTCLEIADDDGVFHHYGFKERSFRFTRKDFFKVPRPVPSSHSSRPASSSWWWQFPGRTTLGCDTATEWHKYPKPYLSIEALSHPIFQTGQPPVLSLAQKLRQPLSPLHVQLGLFYEQPDRDQFDRRHRITKACVIQPNSFRAGHIVREYDSRKLEFSNVEEFYVQRKQPMEMKILKYARQWCLFEAELTCVPEANGGVVSIKSFRFLSARHLARIRVWEHHSVRRPHP